MTIITGLVLAILVLNTLGAIFTVLREVRDISTTWAWLLVLIFVPVIGFGVYLFAGRGLSAKKMRAIQSEYRKGIDAFVQLQKRENAKNQLLPKSALSPASKELINLFLNTDGAPVLGDNEVTLYTTGTAKFDALFADIDAATDHIYVEYYTIYNDELGNALQQRLIAKAEAGVAVKVLYDAWGSQGATAKWWAPLVAAGGEVETYFSSRHLFLDFRLNYRLHRKIVVIDDQIGYIGGFNVGDQYVSRKAKFGHWRDTHMRIIGNTVLAMKVQFLMDWNATVPTARETPYSVSTVPLSQIKPQHPGSTPIQIVSSGPETSAQQIKYGYVKMITGATQSVWLQTPYLIPDDTVIDALITAALAGIDVRVMIPDMPDHPFIFRATQYYANLLMRYGVKVYHYENGFLHAKTVVVDDKIASVGSANLDIRSFKLNFEANAFIYDRHVAHELTTIFTADLTHSRLLTAEEVARQSRWLRFKQAGSRLLSPIL
ncbi:cardiolipin synthase [Lacticaseibacillus absianus]|uniref:cardiolipin synthase n=1 Tax=Lacticaseibacillus absianus TaxID=2729623 RepID=UPI0015C74BFD|nr:cardiolipin synthase [Lacticaseibacillus absianus]